MHQRQGPQLLVVSSSLVLTIRTCESWNFMLIYWLMIDSESLEAHQSGLITLHYRQCSTQSYGLNTIPGPVASNNAACARRKVANEDIGSTTACRHSSASLVASKLETSVLLGSELSRLLLRRVRLTIPSLVCAQNHNATDIFTLL